MVERGIEHGFLVGRAFYLEDAQVPVPLLSGFRGQLPEVLLCSFSLQVLEGSCRAGGREGYLNHQFRLSVGVEVEVSHHLAAAHFGEVSVYVKTSPETVVQRLPLFLVTIVADGLREGDGKVRVVGACPSVGDAVAGQQGVVLHTEVAPQHFAVVVVDAVHQVQNQMALFSFGERIFMNADPLRGGELRPYAVIVQHDFVVAWRRFLGGVTEARAVALVGVVGTAGVQLQRAGSRHQQQVAQVRMPRSAEVGVAEAHDSGVLVTVSGTISIRALLIHSVYVVGDGVCIGTELYPTERSAGSGKDVSHPVGSYQGIDIIRRLLGRDGQNNCQKDNQCSPHFNIDIT